MHLWNQLWCTQHSEHTKYRTHSQVLIHERSYTEAHPMVCTPGIKYKFIPLGDNWSNGSADHRSCSTSIVILGNLRSLNLSGARLRLSRRLRRSRPDDFEPLPPKSTAPKSRLRNVRSRPLRSWICCLSFMDSRSSPLSSATLEAFSRLMRSFALETARIPILIPHAVIEIDIRLEKWYKGNEKSLGDWDVLSKYLQVNSEKVLGRKNVDVMDTF